MRNDQSLIFLVEFEHRAAVRLRLVPVRLEYTVVNLATGEDLEAICVRTQALSAEMGTRLVRLDGLLELTPREALPRKSSRS